VVASQLVADLVVQIGTPVLLIMIGVFAGRFNERRHWRSLARREHVLREVLLLNTRLLPEKLEAQVEWTQLYVSEVVIASDYFKAFAANLRNLIGGRVRTFETLVDRGRREAALRVVEQARSAGADLVMNLRYETATVGRGSRRGMPMAEIIAYGTAVKLRQAPLQ
jgi:uncharacterized protein YbjQ (UPF0145 family)